ncbi:MAG TPA: ATP-binding protein [Terriglobales bacterium]|nr:ATP-binding protein [Terriglobales bacterium]
MKRRAPGAPFAVPAASAVLATALLLLDTIDLTGWSICLATSIGCLIANALWARALERRMQRLQAAIQRWLPEDTAAATADPFRLVQRALASIAHQYDSRTRQAEAEKLQLEAVLGGMIEGVIVLRPDGVIELANQRAAALFGVATPETVAGTPLLSLSRDPDIHRVVHQVAQQRVAIPIITEITLGSGARREILQLTGTSLAPADTKQRRIILVFHDITAIKQLEATRRDFVANVSHEIRTPLTAIRGYAETLRMGAIDDRDRALQFLEVIERHSERLGRLTEDLLALSDLELGRAALQKAPMSIAAAIDTALDVLRDKAMQGKVELHKDISAELPPIVADPDRMVQVLVNLIDNAVKFTRPGGRVTISAAAQPTQIELSVADTGEGVPGRDLPRLTERFYRVDQARSRELGGTGLGLAIVKHIVQAHGGSLRIESELGKGTTVHLLLPTSAQQ